MSILRDYIDSGVTKAYNGYVKLYYAAGYLRDAGDHIAAQEWSLANNDLHNAADRLGDASGSTFWVGGYNPSFTMYWRDALYWIDDNWPSDGEINMDAILKAIWEADGFERFSFINYIDSMRASIWNVQVYDVYLEDLLRHFSV